MAFRGLKSPWLRNRLLLPLMSAAVILFVARAWHLVSVPSQRAQANILVVEGWVFDYGLAAAVAEFETGRYALLATSGIADAAADETGKIDSGAARAARRLIALGIPAERILVCTAPTTRWNRTSSSALAVRTQLAALKTPCEGINLLTIEPHSRQSWLAYRRTFARTMPVGIIAVPHRKFTAENWWKHLDGWRVLTKTLTGCVKEWMFGNRNRG